MDDSINDKINDDEEMNDEAENDTKDTNDTIHIDEETGRRYSYDSKNDTLTWLDEDEEDNKLITSSSFPNIGVSLEVLTSLRDDPVMKKTILELVHPELNRAALQLKELADLRNLARELRLFSDRDGPHEFSMYKKESLSKEFFISALCTITPTTTTHVNIAIVKPQTLGSGACYAVSVLNSHPTLVGKPTDFISHAWRYTFAELVNAIELEHNERMRSDSLRSHAASSSKVQQKRFYWNDIFVEDQNTTLSRPEGYFFTAFREAIASIGRTVLVLEPIQTPIPLTRAWCIWEIWSTIDSHSDLVVVMPPSEEASFKQLIMNDFNSIVEGASQFFISLIIWTIQFLA